MPQSKEQRRASGKVRVELWLPAETVARLDEITAESGYTRAEQVESMIDGEYEEWRGLPAGSVSPSLAASPASSARAGTRSRS